MTEVTAKRWKSLCSSIEKGRIGILSFLIPKLPAPKEEDLSKGILESIDMDSYRVEKQAALRISLADADGELICYCAPQACHGDILVKLFRQKYCQKEIAVL